MIQVAPNGGPSAAREAARTLPDPDQVPKCDWRLVTSRLQAVAAVVALQKPELGPQPGCPLEYRLAGCRADAPGASVTNRTAVCARNRQAPSGTGVTGQHGCQFTACRCGDWPVPSYFTWLTTAEPR